MKMIENMQQQDVKAGKGGKIFVELPYIEFGQIQ